MGYSRGASALGTALALGEPDGEAISDAVINTDFGLFSRRASASAGIELMGHEDRRAGHERFPGQVICASTMPLMEDAIDLGPVRAMFARLGLGAQYPSTRIRGRQS